MASSPQRGECMHMCVCVCVCVCVWGGGVTFCTCICVCVCMHVCMQFLCSVCAFTCSRKERAVQEFSFCFNLCISVTALISFFPTQQHPGVLRTPPPPHQHTHSDLFLTQPANHFSRTFHTISYLYMSTTN